MKTRSLVRKMIVVLAICCLSGCTKKTGTEAPTVMVAATESSNAAPVIRTNSTSLEKDSNHVTLTNADVAAAQTSSPPVSLALKTNTPPPKPVYPANELYEQAVALIKTNESNAAAEKALKLFQEAAEKGNPPAQCALGISYLGGIGVKKSEEDALKWLRKSAEAGYADAQFKLASLYVRGEVVPKDETQAAELARKAADQGHAEAQYNLGTLYTGGKGVPKDEKQAAFWFKKAAEAGQPSAQANLGVLYANGEVFDKNMDEAVKWWKKAAEQGQPTAQFNLGQALTEGKALPKDLVEAYKWYYLAAQQGDRQAAQFRDAVAAELDPSQLADALKRARQFKSDLLARWQNRQENLF
ncbi:MAG TPA: tetratricopeptide repeat protein [Verrucomicrobiae bacterium]|jgi:TPR repeat protein|nr:tetratricopeptide repeat protein [Verrucomicrobiae bacterium]